MLSQPGQEVTFLLLLPAQKPPLPPRQRRLFNHGRVGLGRLRCRALGSGIDLLGGRLLRHGLLSGFGVRRGLRRRCRVGVGLIAAVAIGFGFTVGFWSGSGTGCTERVAGWLTAAGATASVASGAVMTIMLDTSSPESRAVSAGLAETLTKP